MKYKSSMKILIFVLITIFSYILEAYSFQMSIFTYDVVPIETYREVSKERLCEEKRVLIYGIRAYREAK